MFTIMPMVNFGPTMILDYRDLRNEDAAPSLNSLHEKMPREPAIAVGEAKALWLGGSVKDYTEFYKQTCLVGCSVSVTYIGSAETEQG